MQYHEFPNEKRSAKKALKKRLGDCTEYSELMIALCRANNIPSRIVFGRVLNKNGVVELHNWAEVYIKNIGWVPFDPTLADKKNSLSKFSKLENIYVYLSNDRKGRETEWTFYSEGKGNVELDHKQYWE
jgi:transglutaminase-like putative cysteine protease